MVVNFWYHVIGHHVAPSTMAGDQGLVRSARAQALFFTQG